MSSGCSIPYGRRLLPITIDAIALSDPEKTWASIPKSSNLSDGFRDISFGMFANAINRLAWFIEEKLGRSETFATVMYMGVPDIRHFMVIIAAMKTGYKVRRRCCCLLLNFAYSLISANPNSPRGCVDT